MRRLLRYTGKGEEKVALVFGRTAAACHRAVTHLRHGAPGVPVWLFTTAEPDGETQRLCEQVYVRSGGLRLLLQAERLAWRRWVAISIGAWTGERGGWALKAAPFLIPPGRALLLNSHGDFFAGRPAPVARHVARVLRDAATHHGNAAADRFRGLLRKLGQSLLLAAGTVLAWFGHPQHRWFGKLHGREQLEPAVRPSAGQWMRWGAPEEIEDMLPLFADPRTFAVSRQQHCRAWRSMPVPLAPFRALQPGEASQVLAPIGRTILVDPAKLQALGGIPENGLPEAAWMRLFWKAAAAGWRSYSIGARAVQEVHEMPELPMQETAFVLQVAADPNLRRLGPREPDLARGAVGFAAETGGGVPEGSGKLKVLLVAPFLPYPLTHGGAVRMWNLCRALADRVDFVLVAIREQGEAVDYARLREVFRQVYVVDIDQRPAQDDRLPAQVRQHHSAALRALIAGVAREWRPDVLQIEYTHMANFRDAAPDVPAVLVEHDLTFSLYGQLAESCGEPEAAAEYRRWLEFERHWLEAFDAVWTVSEEDRKTAVRESGRPAELTFNVPNGVDVERFRPRDGQEPDAGSAPLEVLYVGSFRHLPNLLGFGVLEREVMPRVWQRLPEARLRVVAGPRHDQFWTPRQLDPRIELHGFVEDLRPLYAGAAVVAVPLQVSAGTNIKVLEAMACGKAVVTTPVGCAGLDLEDGRDAAVRADWDSFAAALCHLITGREERDRIGRQARRTVVERFSWNAIADRAHASYWTLAEPALTQRRRAV